MADEEDLAPTQTTGYKVGEKKTIAELATLDAQDGEIIFNLRISKEMEGIFGIRKASR